MFYTGRGGLSSTNRAPNHRAETSKERVKKPEFPKQYFQNTIRLHFNRKDTFPTRQDIYKALRELIGDEVRNITYICQYDRNTDWYVSFDKVFNINTIINYETTILNQNIKIEDATTEFSPMVTIGFRVSWLPPGFSTDRIRRKFFSNEINEIKIEPEFCIEEPIKHIMNGNFRIKIRVKKDNANLFDHLTGLNTIEGFKCLISRLGAPPVCLNCNEKGHVKRDCPRLKLLCTECNKKGHLAQNCTMSERLKNIEEYENLPDQEPLTNEANAEEPANAALKLDNYRPTQNTHDLPTNGLKPQKTKIKKRKSPDGNSKSDEQNLEKKTNNRDISRTESISDAESFEDTENYDMNEMVANVISNFGVHQDPLTSDPLISQVTQEGELNDTDIDKI